ncbi:NAD(P)H-quinone oxidoreductase [Achromobacter seleniivolatilans]|uniref:NAD(P)H-quinone oxidoreductase n=1 Tax=Achromobacter seleniivolatilans TaxID=3047478 RepID=A0ABY9LW23_9BURK|nr:NAD(P)H-quinone oxidoreductase [Achromobacter sp. R39]WMD18967.1 NAD(P)H-quinone oxidoreductase [Achromobacter sp. R39]
MKAIIFDTFGEADVLQVAEVPQPEVRPDDLLVRVYAAGVNRADLTHRRGGYGRPNFGDSTIMGLEIAGEVLQAGSAVRGYKVGDRVMGVVGGGAYAEIARLDWRMAMPIPQALDYVHAAAIPEVFVTAHEAMLHLGRLGAGDSVLIHAAAGGVGSAAVQLARATGATVYATADATKLDQVRRLGADCVIDYRTQDFAQVVAEQTSQRGVDVVVDFIGAPYFARNIASLAHGGRLVQVGILGGGGEVSIALEHILYRHLQIFGTVMKSRPQADKHAMVRRFREHWLDRFAHGAGLAPVVDSVFTLEQAAGAHRRMESSENVGKIILTMTA